MAGVVAALVCHDTPAAGQRVASITRMIQSAKLKGRDPIAHLKDVVQRLPTQRAIEIGHLSPHGWSPEA